MFSHSTESVYDSVTVLYRLVQTIIFQCMLIVSYTQNIPQTIQERDQFT